MEAFRHVILPVVVSFKLCSIISGFHSIFYAPQYFTEYINQWFLPTLEL